MSKRFTITRVGNDCFCTADDGPRFFVGRRVPYKQRVGLYNVFAGSSLIRLLYSADDFRPDEGFWADFVEPTAICEGRSFLTLNTYDRAAFTFGFGQFAAHVPDGDFVRYLRALLELPDAGEYFPNLALMNGRIFHIDPTPRPLETPTSTDALMAYLNPHPDDVEDSEITAAARFIDWTVNSAAARHAQVEQMIATFRRSMQRATVNAKIDGRPANQCCVIADILHQGRGGLMTWSLIRSALAASDPFEALIAIGAPEWKGRKATLKKAISARPVFAQRHWNAAAQNFV